jgi:integrase
MASLYKLPSGLWRAQVARKGQRHSATFETKSAAQQWATKTEADIMSLARGELPRKTVLQALERYRDFESPKKRGQRWEVLRLDAFAREPWADRWLTALTSDDLAQWRDRRLKVVTAGSVQRDFNLLRAVLTTARKEWKWIDRSPMDDVGNPGENRPRKRRVAWQEVKAICRALGYPGDTKSAEVARAFLIALRTAMRAGEILSLTPEAVNLRTRVAVLTNTKNGDDRTVPLSRAAARLFKGWQGWTVESGSMDALFRKARDRAGIHGLHFHDSRAEALTRLARKVDVLTLAKISGHRDINLLSRVYYRETAEQIAPRLD